MLTFLHCPQLRMVDAVIARRWYIYIIVPTATTSDPSIVMGRGFSALWELFPGTLQQAFICGLRYAQLAFAVLIRQRAALLKINVLSRTVASHSP